MNRNAVIEKFKCFLESKIAIDEEAFKLAEDFIDVKHLKKGEYYVESNKISRHFAFIAHGIMRAAQEIDGGEKTSCICTENAFANSTISFITQTPSNTSIQALTDVTLLTIHYNDLQTLYRQSPFWLHIGRVIMEQEFLNLQQVSWRNSQLSPDEKYLTLMRENPQVIHQVPLRYIASFLNITPETLSRIRKRTATK